MWPYEALEKYRLLGRENERGSVIKHTDKQAFPYWVWVEARVRTGGGLAPCSLKNFIECATDNSTDLANSLQCKLMTRSLVPWPLPPQKKVGGARVQLLHVCMTSSVKVECRY